jgi:hypothetical protein
VIEFAAPYIEGKIAPVEAGWSVNAARHYGLGFSITERR